MTPHNEARAGDYAQVVLLPGDPRRAEWIAETFLTDARCVNRVRNCLGFTGLYNGVPVSVQATGMGQPSTAIYVHELINVYGVKTLIRVGTCGGLSRQVHLRDVVIALAASTNSALNASVFAPFEFAPVADFALVSAAVQFARDRAIPHHVGGVVSDDLFYRDDLLKAYEQMIAHNVLAVEMETSAIYTLAARFGARALSVCTMTDDLVTHASLSPTERQSALTDMVRLALAVATPSP